ncbi:MAG: hypothetical protein J7K82_08055 [Thermoproteales archaeon]|nr:hypothetical protein [Thermoproteales archaeon]
MIKRDRYRYIVFIADEKLPGKNVFVKQFTSLFCELFGEKILAFSKILILEYLQGKGGILKVRRDFVHFARATIAFYNANNVTLKVVKITGTYKKARSILNSIQILSVKV